MTYEEAHKHLENLQRELTSNRYICSDELMEANGLGILALEKQRPKKAFVKYPQKKDWIFCPCGEYLCNIGQQFKPKFCQWCGQAIDFGQLELNEKY